MGIGLYDACSVKDTPGRAEKASEKERKSLGFPTDSGWGGETDALRHAIWERAKIIGKDQALEVAGIHEKHHPPPALPRAPKGYKNSSDWQKDDSAMDDRNNKVGAELGTCQDENFDCAKAARDALVKGKLKINVKGGYRF